MASWWYTTARRCSVKEWLRGKRDGRSFGSRSNAGRNAFEPTALGRNSFVYTVRDGRTVFVRVTSFSRLGHSVRVRAVGKKAVDT